MRSVRAEDADRGGLPLDAISGVRIGTAGVEFTSAAAFQLFEHIPVAISITAGPEHRFVYANSRYRAAVEPGFGSILGRSMREVFGEGLRDEVFSLRDRVLADGLALTIEEEAVPPRSDRPLIYWDITYHPLVGEDGEPSGILTFAVDVSDKVFSRDAAEQRAAEERSRAEGATLDRARLALAVEATELGIWEWNVLTQDTRWSERQKEIWGLAPGQATSYELWRDSIHPDDREAVLARVEQTLDRASGGDQRMEHRIVRPDGETRWVASRGRMIYEEGSGRPLRLIGTVLDITDRKHAEEELKAALATKEILLREVNHRIKNSLQLVSSMLSLQGQRSASPELRQHVQEAQSRVQVVAAVHERLYLSADANVVELGPFLETLCREVERSVIAPDQSIRVEVEADPVTIGNDRAVPLALILNELLTNAIKYAYPGGTGTIEVRLKAEPEGRAVLEISDAGIGLPANFDERQAASIGIRIVAGLARQLGAELDIVRRDPGVSFNIALATGETS